MANIAFLIKKKVFFKDRDIFFIKKNSFDYLAFLTQIHVIIHKENMITPKTYSTAKTDRHNKYLINVNTKEHVFIIRRHKAFI